MMKVFLFSPYFPNHFGGGEKYLLDVATTLAKINNSQVHVAISNNSPLSNSKLQQFKHAYVDYFNHDLRNVEFVGSPLGTSANVFKKMLWTKQYDLGFYCTDGSLFYSLAKKNILHIQVPLKIDKSGFIERQKLKSWDKITTNSFFTKSIVEPYWKITVDEAHQPLVDVDSLIDASDLQQKEKIILNVGRFFPQLHSKRQDILVGIFKRLKTQYKKETKGWRLVLIGGVENQEFAEKVHKLAEGLEISFFHDLNQEQLSKWYQKSSIYWHATGYRINDEDEPHKVEHFGISTVEAMAAGCVPVVIAKGGQKEVIGEDFLKWSWLTQKECIKRTKQLIINKKLRNQLQIAAQKRSRLFGPEVFRSKLAKLI